MDEVAAEVALVQKLADTWHLNVPERRGLPGGRVRASLLLDAIEKTVREAGQYPRGVSPDDFESGGFIEVTPEGTCRIRWKSQVGFSQFEETAATVCPSPRRAAEILVRTLFDAELDGIPIDWTR